MGEPLLKKSEMAAKHRVSEWTITRWTKLRWHPLPLVRVNNTVRFRDSAYEAWLIEREQAMSTPTYDPIDLYAPVEGWVPI